MKSLLIVVPFLFVANSAFALPRFSILTGMQCINCHTNPTGGELRNSFGSSDFVDDHLRLVPAHGDSTDYNFNPQLNDNIRLGGDIRFQYLYDGQQRKTTFQSMEGSIYSLLRLFPSTDLFVKYDFANTAYEAYGLYKFNSDNSYVKVGAFEPSYGIRLDDHTAYTRGGNLGFLQGLDQIGLFFVPDYRDLGVELGSRFGDLFVTVGATNGDLNGGSSNINFDSKKAFIGKAEYLTKGNFMIGASGYSAGSLTMYGLQAGAGLGERLTILGEWDWANSLPRLASDTAYINAKSNAAFVEVTYFISNGLSATGRFDYFRTAIGGPIYERYIIGADIYPIPHVDLMPQVRFNLNNLIGVPRPVEALIQSHIYF
jgi:hypothetical protein